MVYLDGTLLCPSPILKENGKEVVNPNYSLWIRQDQLLLSAILASISTNVIPFVASAKTSEDAWDTLATIYAKPSMVVSWEFKNNYLRSLRIPKV